MNHVNIAPLEHPAHPAPQHAKPATKESSMTKMAPPAKSAEKVPFKIKTPFQVQHASIVQQDGSNQKKVHRRA